MNTTFSLLHSGETLRTSFNQYTIVNRVTNLEVQSTPKHTPTVSTLRLARTPPQLYEAKDTKGKPFAVKAVNEEALNLLMNEWKALEKLSWFQNIPFSKKIAPKLQHGITHDFERKIYFIVFEWLETRIWKNLSKIITSEPLCFHSDAAESMYKLRSSLFMATKMLHLAGIIHGDSKDEHVYLREKNGKILYDQIRLIDFGGCYLNPLDDWKGGSLGFSSPYFWNHRHRFSLSRREMEAIDWYGVYSILFYAFTGECFPGASPAFSKMPDSESDRYVQAFYQELEYTLLNKWQNYPDDVRLFIAECVKYLCAPDALVIPNSLRLNVIRTGKRSNY